MNLTFIYVSVMNQNDSNKTECDNNGWLVTVCKTSSHDRVAQMYNLIRERLLYISTDSGRGAGQVVQMSVRAGWESGRRRVMKGQESSAQLFKPFTVITNSCCSFSLLMRDRTGGKGEWRRDNVPWNWLILVKRKGRGDQLLILNCPLRKWWWI